MGQAERGEVSVDRAGIEISLPAEFVSDNTHYVAWLANHSEYTLTFSTAVCVNGQSVETDKVADMVYPRVWIEYIASRKGDQDKE